MPTLSNTRTRRQGLTKIVKLSIQVCADQRDAYLSLAQGQIQNSGSGDNAKIIIANKDTFLERL